LARRGDSSAHRPWIYAIHTYSGAFPENLHSARYSTVVLKPSGAGGIPVKGAVLRDGSRSMAVHEYECQACHQRFEITQPMHEYERLKEQPPTCPGCGEQQTRPVVSLFSCKPAIT